MNLLVILTFIFQLSFVDPYYIVPFEVDTLTIKDTVENNYKKRIFGGKVVEDGVYTYMIYLVIKIDGNLTQCGGSLITPEYVLTAAHCFGTNRMGRKDVIMVSGKADMLDYVKERLLAGFDGEVNTTALLVQEIKAKEVYIHPDFSLYTSYHDIAIVQGEEEFSPIFSMPIGWSTNSLTVRRKCTIVGWGINPDMKESFKLQSIEDISVSSVDLGCKVRHKGTFLCFADPHGIICSGDSGSPMVCKQEVYGVASHGVKGVITANCTATIESYYTDVYSHLHWLNEVIDKGKSTLHFVFSLLLFFPIILQSVA